MVNFRNKICKTDSEEIADQRHYGLKPSKPKPALDQMKRVYFTDGQALTYRNGKSVHRDAYRKNQDLSYCH